MEKRFLRTGIGSTVFILLIFAAFAVVRPMYQHLTDSVRSEVEAFKTELENKSGLSISYSSFSPSILSVFRIKGIVITDSQNDETLMSIRRLVISYSFKEIFHKDYKNICTGLLIDGLTFEYNSEKNKSIIENFQSMLFPKKNENAVQKESAPKDKWDSSLIDKIQSFLPSSIRWKNVKIHFVQGNNDFSALFQKITFVRNLNSQSASLDVTGNAVASLEHLGTYSTGFSSHAIFSESDQSVVSNFYLTNFNSKDFRINSINFICEYGSDQIIRLKTLRNVFPLFANVKIDSKTWNTQISLEADNLKPFQFVYFTHPNTTIRKLSLSSVDFTSNASYEFKTKSFDYTFTGNIDLPSQFISGGLAVSTSFYGNDKSVNIPKFTAKGKYYDVSYSGNYSFKKIQASGTAEIQKIQLKNGNIISTELYFDPLETGFMVFAPQLLLNDHAFTALQLSVHPRIDKSLDFNFEVSDYSHTESGNPGVVRCEGSLLPESHYIQSSITAENLYLDSILKTISFGLDSYFSENLEKIIPSTASFIFSGELYVSSDLETLSFNNPYSIIANTNKDRQFLVFSSNGNNNSLQISQFNLLFNEQIFNMTAMIELMNDSNELFFSSDMMCNNIPYRINGSASSNWIDLSGDYGFQGAISLNKKPTNVFESFASGSFQFENLPFAIGKYIFSASTETSFSFSKANGFESAISRLELQEPSGRIKANPRISLNGNISKYGFVLNSLAYSDAVSILTGDGRILWNINDNIFDSVTTEFKAESLLSGEKWDFRADVTNPLRTEFSLDRIKKDWYFTGQFDVNSFLASRLLSNQAVTDTITMSSSLSGTFENPYFSMMISPSSISVLGAPMLFSGTAIFEDGLFSFSNADIQWVMLNFSDINMQYALESGSGLIDTQLNAKLFEQTITAPLNMHIDSIAEKKGGILPSSYILAINSEKVEGSIFTDSFEAGLTMMRTSGRYDIYSNGDINIKGSVLDNGSLNFETGGGFPIKANIGGYIHGDGVSLEVTDIYAELKDFTQLLSFPFISIYNGFISGYCKIEGVASDPSFSGQIFVDNADLNLPILVPEHLHNDRLTLSLNNSEFVMADTIFNVKGNPLYVNLALNFDRWAFDNLIINLKTDSSVYVPADVDLGDIKIKGEASFNMQLAITLTETNIIGKLLAKNTIVDIAPRAIATAATQTPTDETVPLGNNDIVSSNYALNVDFDIMMEQSVQIAINPFLRGLVAPGTPLHFSFESLENRIGLDGDISFRGGELAYLSRSFYMRNGRIVFTDRNEVLMDPMITVRAETRERDSDGNQVTITLSADNQLLSMFSPRLTATPAKSENEIMELLGQIVAGDSTDAASLLLATSDYALQVTMMRRLETALRDLCNFDIFSIRTMVLQNAMKQGLNMNGSHNNISAGNFFDNSTVYIGKYFGRELYTDALLHWSYDEDRVDDKDTAGGLVFQPEFGLEMASPYVNIRWGIAPDIDAIKENRWIPTTSVSLSWKFNF